MLCTVQTVLIFIAIPVVAIPLLILLFRRQIAQLRDEITRSGETVLIGPDIGFYQGSNTLISLKTQGVIALTDRRIVFRKPIGADIEIPFTQITKVSENDWFRGNYRAGKKFLILKLADGLEIGFMAKDHNRWIKEITTRIFST